MAIKSMKLGIAVKLEDGWTDEYQGMIIANILEQLKYENTELIEKLKNCYTTKLFNDCGIEVGHSEVDFKLDIDPTFLRSLRSMSTPILNLATLNQMKNMTLILTAHLLMNTILISTVHLQTTIRILPSTQNR